MRERKKRFTLKRGKYLDEIYIYVFNNFKYILYLIKI